MKHLADPDSKDRALTLCGNIARNLNDPRRPMALRILEGLDRK